MITDRNKGTETQPRKRRGKLGWDIQGTCLLLLASGFLAEQAGGLRFESSWTFGALPALMGATWMLGGRMDRRLSRVKAEYAPPNAGPATQPGKPEVTEGPLLAS